MDESSTLSSRQGRVPSGAKCLSIKSACRKLDRGKSWLWDRIKNDAEFPKPMYLSSGSPVLLEHELDAWLERISSRG